MLNPTECSYMSLINPVKMISSNLMAYVLKNRKLDVIVGMTIDNKLTLDNHTGLKINYN